MSNYSNKWTSIYCEDFAKWKEEVAEKTAPTTKNETEKMQLIDFIEKHQRLPQLCECSEERRLYNLKAKILNNKDLYPDIMEFINNFKKIRSEQRKKECEMRKREKKKQTKKEQCA